MSRPLREKTLAAIQAEKERLEKEKAEKERLEKEKAEKAEKEKQEKEKAEKERLEKEKADKEQIEKAEKEAAEWALPASVPIAIAAPVIKYNNYLFDSLTNYDSLLSSCQTCEQNAQSDTTR